MAEQLLRRYQGNCPGNVAKDAKYAVRTGTTGPVVALTYRSSEGERWYATTENHSELVEMVNKVKRAKSDSINGPFYINEYRHVIVPVGMRADYYYAGKYEKGLVFKFDGYTLSGDAVDLKGNPLNAGDEWVGPHPGIPYVLKAGGTDVYYRVSPRPNVTKDVFLSSYIGKDAARDFAQALVQTKGFEGGRFYVNEWRQMFTPLSRGDALSYIYLGKLPDKWFPEPPVE